MKARRIIFALFCLLSLLTYSYSQAKGQKEPSFFNEVMKFSIEIKGISVGSILMRTIKTGNGYLQINAKIESFDSIKGLYYMAGDLGALWDYNKKKSYIAFEDIYDGYSYLRRAYRFQKDNRVYVNKKEVKFAEAGWPHKGDPQSEKTSEYYINTAEYQDLLGVFYTLRSSGIHPKVGEVYRLKVLPAGVKKIMIIKVIDRLEMDVPVLGGKKMVIHVKSGLANPGQKPGGGDIFFKVQSPLDFIFTDDEDAIPVKMWAKVPIIQQADIVLKNYKQLYKKSAK